MLIKTAQNGNRHSHTQTHTHTNAHTYTHTHTITYNHTHTHNHIHTHTDKYDYMAKLGTYVSNKDLECKIYGEKKELKIVKAGIRQY